MFKFVKKNIIINYIKNSLILYMWIKQSGAEEARWAHNPKVNGSKPFSAILYAIFSSHNGLMVKIDAFQALDQGSIPCYGNIILSVLYSIKI